MQHYLSNPQKIKQQTFANIREVSDLSAFNEDEQQIVLQMIKACGDPEISKNIIFSPGAIEAGKASIRNYNYLLCDTDAVKGALKASLIYQDPLCFTSKAVVISQAKSKKQTRAMVAINYWKPYIRGGIALFGQSSSALCYLLDLIEKKEIAAPSLIIAAPAGFVDTATAKHSLIQHYEELEVECIVVNGTRGSCMLAAAAMNTFMMLQKGMCV